MKSINLRMPDDLHAQLVAVVQERKRLDLGASLNSVILEACAAYLAQLQTNTHKPGK